MKIETALSLDDQQLGDMFCADPDKLRQHFEERKANGEILIGAEGCEGFDPVKGCPGHEQ